MSSPHSNPSSSSAKPSSPAKAQGQGDSFDPSGPHGGFGGAGGSQGSVYGDTETRGSGGPSEQRLEHEAWQRNPDEDKRGGVIAGQQGPYGEYGEIQDHHGGYWYGGRDASDTGKKRPPSSPANKK